MEATLGKDGMQERDRPEMDELGRDERLDQDPRFGPPTQPFAEPGRSKSEQEENYGEASGGSSGCACGGLIPAG